MDEGGYRGPDPRGVARMPPAAPPGFGGPVGPVGPRSGEPLPPLQPDPSQRDLSQRDQAQHRDNTTTTTQTSRAAGRSTGAASVPTGVRRTQRPAVGAMLAIGAAVGSLPVLRVLLDGAVGSTPSASGVISSLLVLIGLPLGAVGLYALLTGAAQGGDVRSAWLRPPVAYITVALVLFVAAGLAAS